MDIVIFGSIGMGNNRSQYTKECKIEAARLNSRVMQTHFYLGYIRSIVKGFFSLGPVLKFIPKIFMGYESSNLIDWPNV